MAGAIGFTPVDSDISGVDDGSEPSAFIRRLHPDAIYVADRNFFSYAFINAVFETGSNLVLRLRKNARLDVADSLPLCAKDVEAQVRSDDTFHFRGACSTGNEDHRSFTAKPPKRLLRRVIVRDAED